MDLGSFRTFDLGYYKLLLKQRGIFWSDAALTTTGATKEKIEPLVYGLLEVFFNEFGCSMEKLGRVEVKPGEEGDIRRHCAGVN
ncbi:Peroxidase 3 [Platanthera guangdongensis]|uniref:Peroxidase 3 n=1 Tax=Platanthera guangdongensis TaxID=2320717 RepID=A0ABR2MF59_9ASPA